MEWMEGLLENLGFLIFILFFAPTYGILYILPQHSMSWLIPGFGVSLYFLIFTGIGWFSKGSRYEREIFRAMIIVSVLLIFGLSLIALFL